MVDTNGSKKAEALWQTLSLILRVNPLPFDSLWTLTPIRFKSFKPYYPFPPVSKPGGLNWPKF